MKTLIRLLAAAALLWAGAAYAQSSPGFVFGQVPTPSQWNGYFAGKQNYPIPPGTITNSMIVSPTVTIAGHSVPLGGSQTLGCADLTTASAACSTAVGTAGAVLPLLSSNLTFSGVNTHNGSETFNANVLMATNAGIGQGCTPTADASNCIFNSYITNPRAGGVGLEIFQFDTGVTNSGLHYGASIYEDYMPNALPTGPIGLSPDGILGTIWADPTVSFCRGAGTGCSNNWNITLLTGVFGQGYMWSNSTGTGLKADTMSGIVGAAQLGNGTGTGRGTLNWAVAIDADLTDTDYGGDLTTKGQVKHAVGLAVRPSPCDNGRSMGAAAGLCYGIYFGPYYSDPDSLSSTVVAPNGGSIAASPGQEITVKTTTAAIRLLPGASGIILGTPQTVASLPSCGSSAPTGSHLTVSDATSPTWHGTLTGGGAVVSGALCNGSTWIAE